MLNELLEDENGCRNSIYAVSAIPRYPDISTHSLLIVC